MNFKKQTKPKQTPEEEKLYQSQCMHRERDGQMQHRGHETTPTTGGRLMLASGKDYPSRTLAVRRGPDGFQLSGTHREEWSPERGWCRGCSRDWCRDCSPDSCWDGECGSGLACGREEQQEEELYHTGWLSGQQVRWECQWAFMGANVGQERGTEEEQRWWEKEAGKCWMRRTSSWFAFLKNVSYGGAKLVFRRKHYKRLLKSKGCIALNTHLFNRSQDMVCIRENKIEKIV